MSDRPIELSEVTTATTVNEACPDGSEAADAAGHPSASSADELGHTFELGVSAETLIRHMGTLGMAAEELAVVDQARYATNIRGLRDIATWMGELIEDNGLGELLKKPEEHLVGGKALLPQPVTGINGIGRR